MMSQPRLGTTAFIALVALRIGIGIHFYMEGVAKIKDPKPYSSSFFAGAKGHFAPFFRGMIYDPDGLARLDQETTVNTWDHYRQRAIEEYGLSDQQAKQAQRLFEQRKRQLDWWLDVNETDIAEYKLNLERRNQYWKELDRMEVASLRGQVAEVEGETTQSRRDIVGPIDLMWTGYVKDLQQLAGAGKPLSIQQPGRRTLDSESIDVIIRYFDVAIGAMLILGLFTRVAGVLGAGFLGAVVASQWPGAWGAMPVWPQFIEMLGLLVLAATGAGRFAGLDFLFGSLRRWCCPPKQGDQS